MASETKPVLAYWDFRGLAQPIRLLLEYTGTSFEDKYYKCGSAPDFDKSCWYDVKKELGFDFPNLPYYIDGDVKVTQSNAILRYIARKHDLCGATEDERRRVDLLESQATDFRNGLDGLCYHPKFDTLKPTYVASLASNLERFSAFLGDRKYFAGDKITFPDFVMYEVLFHHALLSPDCLSTTPNLKKFMTRVESLDAIAAYMSSPRFLKAPLNDKTAKFGYE